MPKLLVEIIIQTKYYNSARGSLEVSFHHDTGMYRYMNDGQPMQLEVPSDQYDKVLELFKKKIADGKVQGVTDPNEANNIVRKGRLTYKQAVNLTKAGTIESLQYDVLTGAVMCSCVFGITFIATTFLTFRETGDIKESIYAATIVNGIRALSGKLAIYGAAATKSLAKIMRSNVLTFTISFAIFSVPDTYNLATQKISASQYAKNITVLVGGVVAGGFIGGTVGAKAVNLVGDILSEDDIENASRLFNAIVTCMVSEYLFNADEIDKLVKALSEIPQKELKVLFTDLIKSHLSVSNYQSFQMKI